MSPIKVLSPDNQTFLQRFVFPAAIGLGTFLTLFWTYYLSWYVDNRLLHYIFTDIVGALFGFFLMFSVFFVYPLFFFRGARLVERIAGSFLITFFWSLKEVYRMTEFYSLGESFFFLLFPIQSNIILMSFGFMGLSEILCRFIAKKYQQVDVKAITPLPITVIIIVLTIVVFTIHDGGVTYFFLYNDLYKLLFM